MNATRLTVARRLAVLGFAFLLSLVYPARESESAAYTWTQFVDPVRQRLLRLVFVRQLGEQWHGRFRGR